MGGDDKGKNPEKEEDLLRVPVTIKDRWRINARLGGGAFGQVYVGYDLAKKVDVAVKVEPSVNNDKQVLRMEVAVLKKLQGMSQSVCRYFGSGSVDGCNFVVMELLGENLADIRRNQPNQCFSLNTAVLIGLQMLDAIECIHEAGYLHRDIKPSNFAVGREGAKRNRVFLLDFGLARRHLAENGKVRTCRATAGFRGTARYASIAAHKSQDLGRKDDLWSLFYVMVELATGRLPWRRIKEKEKIGEMKERTDLGALTSNLPLQFLAFADYLSQLGYADKPNYDIVRSLFKRMLNAAGLSPTSPMDWVLPAVAAIPTSAPAAAVDGDAQDAPAPAAAACPEAAVAAMAAAVLAASPAPENIPAGKAPSPLRVPQEAEKKRVLSVNVNASGSSARKKELRSPSGDVAQKHSRRSASYDTPEAQRPSLALERQLSLQTQAVAEADADDGTRGAHDSPRHSSNGGGTPVKKKRERSGSLFADAANLLRSLVGRGDDKKKKDDSDEGKKKGASRSGSRRNSVDQPGSDWSEGKVFGAAKSGGTLQRASSFVDKVGGDLAPVDEGSTAAVRDVTAQAGLPLGESAASLQTSQFASSLNNSDARQVLGMSRGGTSSGRPSLQRMSSGSAVNGAVSSSLANSMNGSHSNRLPLSPRSPPALPEEADQLGLVAATAQSTAASAAPASAANGAVAAAAGARSTPSPREAETGCQDRRGPTSPSHSSSGSPPQPSSQRGQDDAPLQHVPVARLASDSAGLLGRRREDAGDVGGGMRRASSMSAVNPKPPSLPPPNRRAKGRYRLYIKHHSWYDANGPGVLSEGADIPAPHRDAIAEV